MINHNITFRIKNTAIVVTSITAKEYYEAFKKSISIVENYSYYLSLYQQIKYKALHVNYPWIYAALKTLFGESATTYDDYKCSFSYPFILDIDGENKKSKYALNMTDVKGGISFPFRKILTTPEELEKYKERYILYEPLEDEFSKEQMEHFMTWFVFYLEGFIESFQKYYDKEFARSQDYCFMIYGYKDKRFFLDEYENQDNYYIAKKKILESGNIPFNRVKANL